MNEENIPRIVERKFSELPEDSTRIFKRNTVDRCIDHPCSIFRQRKFSTLNFSALQNI